MKQKISYKIQVDAWKMALGTGEIIVYNKGHLE